MASDDVQTNIRIPAELKDRLTSSTFESGRSLSAEVAFRIAQAYELEVELGRIKADFASRTRQLLEMAESASKAQAEHENEKRVVAALKARLEFTLSQHKSEIAQATQRSEERAASFEARASASEKGLDAQVKLNSILSHFVAELADLVPATSPSLTRTLALIRQVGLAAKVGDLAGAVGAAQALVFHGVDVGILEQDGKTLSAPAKKAVRMKKPGK